MISRPTTRIGLIERAGLTFESFLDREFGSRFYSEEFLNGLCRQREQAHARLSKFAGSAFVFSSIIAFFDLMYGSISLYGISINLSRDLMSIAALFVASSILGATMAFLDDQVLHRILMKIGLKVDIHHFPLLVSDKFSLNIGIEALTPRFFGLRSRLPQIAAFVVFSAVMTIAILGLYAFPSSMVIFVFIQTWLYSDRWIARLLSTISFVVLISSFLMIIMASIRFRFDQANFRESTTELTEEFKHEMRRNLSGDGEKSEDDAH